MRTPAPFVFAAAAAVVLAGCGGGGRHALVGGALPSCANPGKAVKLPPQLSGFPLPDGTLINGVRTSAGHKVYEGLIAGHLGDVRRYFQRELPKRGYRISNGDSETHEAEADFSGHGTNGHFRLNDLTGCAGVVRIEVALR